MLRLDTADLSLSVGVLARFVLRGCINYALWAMGTDGPETEGVIDALEEARTHRAHLGLILLR